MENNTILVYTQDSLQAQKLSTGNAAKTASAICNGFEVVSVRMLLELLPGTVFICDDNFAKKLEYHENIVGTMLYDNGGYKIMGSICIVKCIYSNDGYQYTGFTNSELEILLNVISALQSIDDYLEKHQMYRGFLDDEQAEKAIVKSLVFKYTYHLKKCKKENVKDTSLISLLDTDELDWILQEVTSCIPISPDSTNGGIIIARATKIIRYAQELTLEISKRKGDNHGISAAII